MKYNPKKNYCNFFPNEIGGVNYNYFCYLHDENYGFRVKKRKDRKGVDLDLRDRIYNKFLEKNKKPLGFIISRIIYSGTRLFGWIRWYN